MTHASPQAQAGETPEATYRRLLQHHTQLQNSLLRRRARVLQLLAADVLAFIVLALVHVRGNSLTAALPYLLTAALFIFLVNQYLRVQAMLDTQFRLLTLYTTALARVDGTELQSGYPGPAPEPTHLYARDLDLFGPASLFGLLCTVRTTLGERGLARYLTDPVPHEQSLLRQQAVRELTPQLDLRERIALLGATPVNRISTALLDDWLNAPVPTFPRWLRPALIATSAVIVFLIPRLFAPHPSSNLLLNLAVVLAVQTFLCARVRAHVQPLLTASERLQRSVRLLTEGIALLDSLTLTAPALQHLQQAVRQPTSALRQLRRLQSQLAITEQRGQPYFLPISLLLAGGTQVAISLARWHHEHAPQLRLWIDAFAAFEALNALATYAFEHPPDDTHYCWPTLLASAVILSKAASAAQPKDPHPACPVFHATNLAHPLLPAAVPNDISLDAAGHPAFLLISGSNMAGKSTLLRAIGINAVLAYVGAPARAASLTLTPLALGASLALTDSLAEGRSKFLAEVERLSAIARLSASTPVLFLVDEIFSGTNSADRRTAAAAVLKQLLANRAIGALSTHDLALTELASNDNSGLNVHMASPDPEDPLAFDYKLKPGVNTSSNALAIIRLLGL